MNWATANLIFQRETRDQLRDRRTLFMIVALPVLLYPLLGLGLMQMTLQFGRTTRTIGIVGIENLPAQPRLLNEAGDRFAAELFENPENQDYYHLDSSVSYAIADLRSNRIDLLIEIPAETADLLKNNEQVEIAIHRNATNDNSTVAYAATMSFLKKWEQKIVSMRLRSIGETDEFADPIHVDEEHTDVTSAEQRSGTVWSRLIPFVLVMMALTGAFYPAIDMCAGEKERGTMETLLITPASRGEIVTGKFLAILSFSIATTIFNLISMGLTFAQIASAIQENAGEAVEEFAPPSFAAIAWMLLLMLPLAAFFSALCMAFSVFARSTKEGQYYLMPMFIVVTPLIFITMAPGVELTAFYSLVPITNVALLLRTLMLNQYDVALVYMLPVLAPTVLYSYLALRFALDRFNREEVLFREAERFELGLWLRQLLSRKDPTPTTAEAWSCYVLMLLLMWYGQGRLTPTMASLGISQLAMIAFPAVLMALLLTSRPRATLGLGMPRILPMTFGLLLVFTLHPVVISVGQSLEQLIPLRDDLREGIAVLFEGTTLAERLFFVALIPAICEELAFRGFILSGLRQTHPPARAILISSVFFGVFHLIPQQMITATLLGLVLGVIATRTGSIIPAIVFHALHNGMVVLHGHVRAKSGAEMPLDLAEMGYNTSILVLGALGSAVLIGSLVALPPQPMVNDGQETAATS